MAGDIVWYVTVFGCAALFVGIGVYAGKLNKPIWFWANAEMNPAAITNVKEYNKENARMWILYSLWYWVSGFAWIWSKTAALAVLFLGCSAGIVILVRTYLKIEKKYQKTGL